MADNEERKRLLREQEDLLHDQYVARRLLRILEPEIARELAAEETRWSLVLRLRELEDHYDACVNILMNSVIALQQRTEDSQIEDTQLSIDEINQLRQNAGKEPLPPPPTAICDEVESAKDS